MPSTDKVDVGGLLSGGRQRLVVDQFVTLEPFETVRFEKPVHVHLDLHGTGDMLEVTGTIEATYAAECDRCLSNFERTLEIAVDEQLDVEGAAKNDPFGPENVLSGDRLDVRDLAMQLVCSAIPLSVVCTQSCKGICPRCGQNNNTGECVCPPMGEE